MNHSFFNFRSSRNLRFLRFLLNIPNFVKLAWRLFKDTRVPIHIKAIWVLAEAVACVLAVAYFVLPIDFLPDFHILTRFDDLLIGLFLISAPGTWLFVKLCPRSIVLEHVEQMTVHK